MEQLIVGLILALLTGLTILAYRHSQSYKLIVNWIMVPVLFVILGMAVWNVAVYKTHLNLISGGIYSFASGSEDFDKMQKVLEDTEQKLIVPSGYIWTLALVNVYFSALTFLPLLLKKKQEEAERQSWFYERVW